MGKHTKEQKVTLTNVLKLAFFAAVIWVIFRWIIILGYVPTSSMEPTIYPGDIVLNNGLAYIWNKPERGDIIIFESAYEENQRLIKRIIGLPGEEISFLDGCVYVDGVLLEEDYLEGYNTYSAVQSYIVPEGEYFVMGDNRMWSEDSRYWPDAYIDEEQIKGRMSAIFSAHVVYDWFQAL